jgi:hypothetical protein
VIYAGFVAQPMGWLPAQKGRQKGPLEVPNKASYIVQPNNIQQTLRSYYIPLQQVIQKRLFQNFHFILGCDCLAIIKLCQVWFGCLDQSFKKLIFRFGLMWFLATYLQLKFQFDELI